MLNDRRQSPPGPCSEPLLFVGADGHALSPSGPFAGGPGASGGVLVTDLSDLIGSGRVHGVAPRGTPAESPAVVAAPAERSEGVSRAVNTIIAGLAILLLAPVCVLVAIAIKLTSPGPVFYTQTRVGLDRRWRQALAAATAGDGADGEDNRRMEDLGGQPFTILKFRSMRTDAEANGQAVWAAKHDTRITPVGRVLRKTRLDEIPQLINVLRGEMNIVGPRPERPSIVVRLCESIPEYPHRHRVKPGITGWAQINHSYDVSIDDVRTKVRFDLEYIGRQGMWFDLRIMFMTLPVMLFKRGAH